MELMKGELCMTNTEHFEKLLSNFRFSEAIGYISALVNEDKISVERGQNCENFIRAYQQVICDSLWDGEGLLILSACKIDDAFKDISDEKNRLVSLISEWMKNEKRTILYFVSAYYAIANIDGLRMKMNMDKIIDDIKDESLIAEVSKAIGGYDRFQAVGNALEKYYHLDESIFEIIKELNVSIQP